MTFNLNDLDDWQGNEIFTQFNWEAPSVNSIPQQESSPPGLRGMITSMDQDSPLRSATIMGDYTRCNCGNGEF